jgi:hypothetical protein
MRHGAPPGYLPDAAMSSPRHRCRQPCSMRPLYFRDMPFSPLPSLMLSDSCCLTPPGDERAAAAPPPPLPLSA